MFTAADTSCGYAVGLGRFLGCEDRLDPVVRDYAVRLAGRPAFQRARGETQLAGAIAKCMTGGLLRTYGVQLPRLTFVHDRGPEF